MASSTHCIKKRKVCSGVPRSGVPTSLAPCVNMYKFAGVTTIVRRNRPNDASAIGSAPSNDGRTDTPSNFVPAPNTNQLPNTNSATPVQATWKNLLPGKYQIPESVLERGRR